MSSLLFPHLLKRSCASSPIARHRRTFLSLPDLSSLSPFSSPQGPTRYNERKVFPYKPSQLYSIVADVSSYPRFVPFCTGARILNTKPADGQGRVVMDGELTVGFLNFTESYVSQVTCIPHTSVEAVASTSTPLFETLKTTWRFKPASEVTGSDVGPTVVTLDLEFAFTSPLHAAVSSAFFGQVSKQMVSAFEQRCVEVYGPGTAR